MTMMEGAEEMSKSAEVDACTVCGELPVPAEALCIGCKKLLAEECTGPAVRLGVKRERSQEVVAFVRALAERLGCWPSQKQLRSARLEALAARLGHEPTAAQIAVEQRIWLWMKRQGVSRAQAVEDLAERDAIAAETRARVHTRDLLDLRRRLGLMPDGSERPPSKPMSREHRAKLDAKKAKREKALADEIRAKEDARDIQFASREARKREFLRRLNAGLIPYDDESGPEGMDWTPSEADIDMKILEGCREYRRKAEHSAEQVKRLKMKAATKELSIDEFDRLRGRWESLQEDVQRIHRPWFAELRRSHRPGARHTRHGHRTIDEEDLQGRERRGEVPSLRRLGRRDGDHGGEGHWHHRPEDRLRAADGDDGLLVSSAGTSRLGHERARGHGVRAAGVQRARS